MAGYKVSNKLLRQQGEDIKAAAKLVDGYAERVGQIRGKLGSDGLLAEARGNLQKLQAQLGESRTVLNVAGEFLVKTVEGYSGTETRQVKKVDGAKAHNRDFYKNPVVVASAGGAVGGAAATGAASAAVPAPAASATTVNYVDNSVTNVAYVASEPAVSAVVPEAQPVAVQTVATEQSVSAPAPATASDAPTAAAQSGSNGLGVVAGTVLGGAAAVAGGIYLKKKRDASTAAEAAQAAADSYDPEAELEKAIARVRELESEGELSKNSPKND
jgi:hypothetical protein